MGGVGGYRRGWGRWVGGSGVGGCHAFSCVL